MLSAFTCPGGKRKQAQRSLPIKTEDLSPTTPIASWLPPTFIRLLALDCYTHVFIVNYDVLLSHIISSRYSVLT